MKNFFDNSKIDIPCPGCGAKNSGTLKQVRTRAAITCKGCHSSISLSQKGRGIEEANAAMEKFTNDLRKLGFR